METSNLPTITVILACLSLALSIAALWQIRVLNKMKKTFFAGRQGADLEHVIEATKTENESLRQEQTALALAFERLKEEQKLAVQKIGIVRFNPFNDSGGNFSFVVALLNANNTGLVITSMHGREQNRVYTKKINNGRSEIKLTDEEEQAIKTAGENQNTNLN